MIKIATFLVLISLVSSNLHKDKHDGKRAHSERMFDMESEERRYRSSEDIRRSLNAMTYKPEVERRNIQAKGIVDAISVAERLKRIQSPANSTRPRSRPSSHGDVDYDYYRHEAMKLWLQKLFLNVYKKIDLPSPSEVSTAKETYNQLKETGFDAKRTSGVITDISNSKIKQIVNLWVGQKVISSQQGEKLKTVMDGKMGRKEIKDMVFMNTAGEIIYSIIGYMGLRTSQTQEKPIGTVFYTFGKFKLRRSPEIEKVESNNCILWGMVCKTAIRFRISEHPLTNKQQTDLQNYMRYTLLKNFDERNYQFSEYLEAESDRYQRFLPENFKSDVKKIKNNPDKRPDQLVNHDIFNPQNYLPSV